MHNLTKIYINSVQFIHNLQSIRQCIGASVKICLPIKDNAYGHGAKLIASISAPYVDYFAVSNYLEAVEILSLGLTKPILLFGGWLSEQLPELVTSNIELTIASFYQIRELVAYLMSNPSIDYKIKIHFKFDTGMNRIGVTSLTQAKKIINYILDYPQLNLVGVYSHFACSDDVNSLVTSQQMIKFSLLVDYVKQINPDIICHIANSGGVAYYPDSYLDMVRPGLLSYGYFPGQEIKYGALANIKPILSLISQVVYLKQVTAGENIGYGHSYRVMTTSIIATIAIGYGDGYRRGLSNCQDVLINGNRYPVVGTICMDCLMVNLGQDNTVKLGDEVVLLGEQYLDTIRISEMSHKLNTIDYEILTGLSMRIPRVI